MKSILFLFWIACSTVNAQKAVAVLKTSVINGVIVFEKTSNGVSVSANISDLTPEGLHGFHIHQFGDLSDGCISAGPHFNPNNYTHGSPNDTARHVGDLGNVLADSKGTVVHHIVDHQIELTGTHSIIGRAVVVHALRDDLGQGTGDKAAESKKTGNAGGRVACGVIGLSKD